MKFALKSLNGFVLAGLLATVSSSAMAQSTTGNPAPAAPAAAERQDRPQSASRMMGRHDPAKMQAWIAKRQTELKAKLKITTAQEGAWTGFTAAMQPSAGMRPRPTPEQRAEFDKLATPERIDKMRAMRTERMTDMNAQMDKRGDATKALYAALSPEQRKTFDAETMKMARHGGRGHHEGGMRPRG